MMFPYQPPLVCTHLLELVGEVIDAGAALLVVPCLFSKAVLGGSKLLYLVLKLLPQEEKYVYVCRCVRLVKKVCRGECVCETNLAIDVLFSRGNLFQSLGDFSRQFVQMNLQQSQ